MVDILSGKTAHEIASGGLVARFCPEMGGRMLEFGWKDGPTVVIPAEPQAFEVTNWPRAGAYPLVPYHNRLADAVIAVEGEAVRLRAHPAALPHTLHGPGHARPWRAGAHGERHFSMHLDYAADEDWPWDFAAAQHFEICGTGLSLALSVENRSQRPMPAGMGWHPYFAGREAVRSDAQTLWPHRPDYLPEGSSAPAPTDGVIRAATAYLSGWNRADIPLAAGRSVRLSASGPFGFLVVHRGDPAHVCVEPVTHLANGWNLPLPPQESGARFLAPGEVLAGSITLSLTAP